MDRNIKIAENLTVGNWLDLKVCLERDMENPNLWHEATEFFDKRVATRYLKPIRLIEAHSSVEGEGFSIMAIICSLIEALETFRQGKTYRKPTKDSPLHEETEYFRSQPIFESFLTKRDPFRAYFFDTGCATAFYENVRCGILHEAATRNGWKVRIDTDALVEKRGENTVINRALMVQALESYLANYKGELAASLELKKAYIRKLDSICNSA